MTAVRRRKTLFAGLSVARASAIGALAEAASATSCGTGTAQLPGTVAGEICDTAITEVEERLVESQAKTEQRLVDAIEGLNNRLDHMIEIGLQRGP